MIELIITDGIGNQMFQYAYARYLSMHKNEIVNINTYSYTEDKQREYEIGDFVLNSELIRYKSSNEMRTQYSKIKWIYSLLFHLGLLKGERRYNICARLSYALSSEVYKAYELASIPSKLYVYGRFQSYDLVRNMRDILRKEFSLKTPLSDENRRLIEKMRSESSVCIHIRRGDYITSEEDARVLNICGENYYLNAIEKIRNLVDNPVFYVFSNDHNEIEWIKDNYGWDDAQVRYVDANNSAAVEMTVMSNCRHFIICNSTFGWWAQYLGDYSDKKVVAPTVWNRVCDYGDIYDPEWILLDAN